VWQFPVEVDNDNNMICTFTAETSMEWDEFRVLMYVRLELPPSDVHLKYRVRKEKCSWVKLACQSNWNDALGLMQVKAGSAQKQVAVLELKNAVSNMFALWTTEALTLFIRKSLMHRRKRKRRRRRSKPAKTIYLRSPHRKQNAKPIICPSCGGSGTAWHTQSLESWPIAGLSRRMGTERAVIARSHTRR
jgi:hypothetical protein